MGLEIEHKYLVTDESFKEIAERVSFIKQGYISKDPERVVRVRIKDSQAFLTIKGKNQADTRLEFEYPIPIEEAESIMNLCLGTPIEKQRWIVKHDNLVWEIDEFINRDIPTIAEVELPFSHHNYSLPGFIGKEITGDPQYYNSNL